MTFRTMMATAAALALLGLMPASAADSVLTAKVAGAQRAAESKARRYACWVTASSHGSLTTSH